METGAGVAALAQPLGGPTPGVPIGIVEATEQLLERWDTPR